MPVSTQYVTLPLSYHYALYTPAMPEPAPALIVSLHGYAQTGKVAMQYARRIREDWAIAALQAPHPNFSLSRQDRRLGFGWVSDFNAQEGIRNHHDFVRTVIERAFAAGVIAQPRAFLFGFSQSVSLNYRFAAAQPDYVQGIIAVAGAAPSDWEVAPEVKLAMPVLHIAPSEDEAYPLERAKGFKHKLEQHFSNLIWHEEAGGHRVPRAAYPLIKNWLDNQV